MSDGGSGSSAKPGIEAAKRELFGYLLQERGVLRGPRELLSAPNHHEHALSFAQEQLWFLDQLDPNSPAYNICRAYNLVGSLNVECLQRAFDEIIRRHAILRSSFKPISEEPCQQTAPELSLQLSVEDLRDAPLAERDKLVIQLIQEAARAPFLLQACPLLRVVLLRLDEELWALCVVTHQIVCDGSSFGLLNRELETFYRSAVLGEVPAVPELAIQYSDYVRWQRDWLNGEAFDRQLSFWQSQHTPLADSIHLPIDYGRPAVPSYQGSRRRFLIVAELTAALKAFCGENNASLFETMLSTFVVLLRAYSQQQDIVLGCPVSNRYAETPNLIGLFVNTLLLRVDLHGAPSFRDLVARVRGTCRSAFAHRDLPFQKLVEAMSSARDLNRNPLFNVMFALQGESDHELHLHGLKVEPIEIDNGTAKFDLMLSLEERGQELVGFIEYSTALFESATIERLAGHFLRVLEGLVAAPDRTVSALPLLREDERRQLVYEWNDTAADYPKEKCIHQLFEEQVERTSDSIALEFAMHRATYRDLNRQANQLAHHLISMGVGPDQRVGIFIERSVEMVVGMLGILKAGATYVPLDPAYPSDRLRFMVEDADIRVLVTQDDLLSRASISKRDAQLAMICLDRDHQMIAQQSGTNPRSAVTSDNLAYVIYTSGSTGQPKGVEVSHRSVVNCLCAIGSEIGLTDQDFWYAVTTISFDIAALEIFLPLITGAKVALASLEESLDGEALAAKLDCCAATVMQATPTSWTVLLDSGWKGFPDFKVLCGGEALSRRLADRLLEGGGPVWNLYGPTETTIWSTVHRVSSSELSVYIGRPLANTQIYICDAQMQPVPIGVHGDLWIGGDGVARGYLNRPGLTAERFIQSPFSDNPQSRLYKTGDRARHRPDGNIEFLGRSDTQVKIRGHRIELGEIEAALTLHPAVKECVAVSFDQTGSESDNRKSKIENPKSLAAYFISGDPKPTVAELRQFLSAKLPGAMIPSFFVSLQALPLTPNGKFDRNALPPPDGEYPELGRAFVAPRSELEELVAQVWCEVLKRDQIGAFDNFFDLGGHSLLATRLAARLRANFNIELPLRKLFELPTVAQLSEEIDAIRRSGSGVSLPPMVPVSRDRQIPLSFSQQRLWFLRQIDPHATAYNIPSVFRVRGPLNVACLEQALNGLIARHELLRTVFAEKDGQPVQVIAAALSITIQVIDISSEPEAVWAEKVRAVALDEARTPFDLAQGPLLRAKLVLVAECECILILMVDHTILDGTSKAIFLRELSVWHQALLEGRTASLPALPLQYADYAVWQHDRLKDGSFDSQLEYWKRRFDGASPLAEIPTQHGRPPVQTSRGARMAKALSEEVKSEIKALSRREGVTLFMTLLAAFDILLSRHTGSDDLVIGSTIAGRSRSETENMIGFFINALPLRVDVAGNPTFVELLKRVRDVCLDAYTHQDIPFEKIVEAVNPQRDLSRNPLFQTLFNIADVSERVLSLRGCEVTNEQLFDPEAKFDLTLYAPEKEGALELAIVYNVDLFDAPRITALLEQYADLLVQAVTHPERTIAEYDLQTEQARAVVPNPITPLSDDWRGAVHELFSRCAASAPDRPAVSDAADVWSYTELEQASNRLANDLIAKGVAPTDCVAIYAHRDASLVVALMGMLKAGGVFTILDPAYPPERLISYLRVARPKGWIQLQGAGAAPLDILRYLDASGVVCRWVLPSGKNEILEQLRLASEREPAVVVEANSPAYIAFTSGSTGEPKGVLSRHGPITHFLPWQVEAWKLREDDRFALLSGLAYNHLHRDVFTPLAMGAELYIPPAAIAREPQALVEWLRANSITVLHLTPALGQLLLTAGEGILTEVRRIFFGGDVLTQGEVASIRRLAPHAMIGCFYGATETQRAVGYYEIAAGFAVSDADLNLSVPLGRGIEDVQLLVLNKSMKLAGIGELGDLYMRSPHLAQGYINDDERTAAVFIANPFTHDPADRLYKTGELARYLPDGNVEWAGRNDRRVNIRGFRIELEEIEAVLKQHPTVKDAAVIMVEMERDSDNRKSKIENPKSLVAYVAAEEDPSQSLSDLLRGYLSSRLPEYMVPAHFVTMERLPLSPNGKVDYRALPPIPMPREDAEVVSAAPRNEIESKLCGIIGQVLGRESVGIDENFFRIGGHSLSAAQAAARIREAFGIHFELRRIFELPTIIALAKEVELRLQGGTKTPIKDDTGREEVEI